MIGWFSCRSTPCVRGESWRRQASAVLCATLLAACAEPDDSRGPPDSARPDSEASYSVAELSESQLLDHLQFACDTARLRDRKVLLEFGAGWCADCRELKLMESQPPLRDELALWQVVHVNLGEDLHPKLREDFSVRAIARWVALSPTECGTPVSEWPRLATRVVEPQSGTEASAEQLATWLERVRESKASSSVQ